MRIGLLLAAPTLSFTMLCTEPVQAETILEETLSNGLRVAISPDHSVPLVAIRIQYHEGSGTDPKDLPGLSDLVGKLLPEVGSLNLPGTERTRATKATGILFYLPTVSVGTSVTAQTSVVPSGAIEHALWIEAERMAFASSSLDDWAFSFGIRTLAEAKKPETPSTIFDQAFLSTYFENDHPNGRRGVGRIDETNFSLANLRAHLRRRYVPSNADLIIVGDVSEGETLTQVRKYFGAIQGPLVTKTAPPVSTRTKTLVEMTMPGDSSWVSWAFPTPAHLDPGDPEFDVLSRYLRVVLLERLHQKEKIVDGVLVRQRSYPRESVFNIQSKLAPGQTIESWEKGVAEELEKIRKGDIDDEILISARAAINADIAATYDSLNGHSELLGLMLRQRGTAKNSQSYYEAFAHTTKGSLAALASHYLTPERVVRLHAAPGAGGKGVPNRPPVRADILVESQLPLPTPQGDLWLKPPRTKATARVTRPPFRDEIFEGVRILATTDLSGPRERIGWSFHDQGTPKNPWVRVALANMLRTTKVGTGRQLYQELTHLGAVLQSGLSPDSIRFSVGAGPERTRDILKVLHPALLTANLTSEDFAREFELLKKSSRDETSRAKLVQAANQATYPATHRYSRLNDTGALEQLTFKDVQSYYEELKRTASISLVLVGRLAEEDAVTFAREAISLEVPKKRGAAKKKSVLRAKTGLHLCDQPGENVEILLSWPASFWTEGTGAADGSLPWLLDESDARKGAEDVSVSLDFRREWSQMVVKARVKKENLVPYLTARLERVEKIRNGEILESSLKNARLATQKRISLAIDGTNAKFDWLRLCADADRECRAIFDTYDETRTITDGQIASRVKQLLAKEHLSVTLLGPVADLEDELQTLALPTDHCEGFVP